MKILKYALIVTFVVSIFSSCDKGFEELNKNPNEPTKVPSGLLLADVVRNTGNNLYSTFIGGDMGECWGQHWAKVQYNDEARYIPRSSIIEAIWKNFYEDVVSDASQMEALAAKEGNDAGQGAAIVMQAYAYLILTDYFGDIPFSEAAKAQEGIFTPKYDSQQDVYHGVIDMLNRASDLLASGRGSLISTSDLLYGGDVAKWEKFANSLQFRALMRISGKEDVKDRLTTLMGKPMFASNDDDAELTYLSAKPNANPIWETVVDGVREEFKVNSVLVDMLQNNSDPRLDVYVAKNAAGEYRGKPAGIFDLPSDDYNYDNVSPIGSAYLQPEKPAVFMSYSELLFFQAEAAKQGWITGSAKDFYEAGVKANLEKNGKGDDYATYIATPFAAYNDANAMEKIATQKWLALFCQGAETWTEWRRTKIPALTPAIDGNINEIPSRIPYPSIEQSVNKDNYNAAVSSLGGDLLTTKFWWLN